MSGESCFNCPMLVFSSSERLSLILSFSRLRDAWRKLGNMGQEEAMLKYIELVDSLLPNWRTKSTHVGFHFTSHNTSLHE